MPVAPTRRFKVITYNFWELLGVSRQSLTALVGSVTPRESRPDFIRSPGLQDMILPVSRVIGLREWTNHPQSGFNADP